MSVFDRTSAHEQVVFAQDEASGLRAIIAIYSTVLGPALGGTRFYPYPDEQAAVDDVLDLSRAMAYKAACAGLPLGGGKAVIMGDPEHDKSEDLLRAYGRFVDSLGGRYYTACDVGTYVDDMAVIGQESRYVTGRPTADGGAGDSSVLTAYGVFRGMGAAAEHAWGKPSLRGRRVGVLGTGKVGRHLIDHLLDDGASVVVADLDPDVVRRVCADRPAVQAADPDALAAMELDVFAPCALGGVLDEPTVAGLRAAIVCGAANNQLAHPDIDRLLKERGILYAPDYVVNAGGLIQVADEIGGYDNARATAKASEIFDTTRAVLDYADTHDLTPGRAADQLAERRIAAGRGSGAVSAGPLTR